MQNRTALVVLSVALCATFALGGLDVATEIVRPEKSEEPGLVPVRVRLSNVGDVPALVPRLNVRMRTYADSTANVSIAVGKDTVVTLNPWVHSGFADTSTAYITYPADTNHSNDTNVVVVNATVEVATEIMRPLGTEPPGLVPVRVKLINLGDVYALVPRLDVSILPSGYESWCDNIRLAVGESTVVWLSSWDYAGGTETCAAYMTCPTDTNHSNDTDVVVVNAAGVSGWVEMEPYAGMSLAPLPSPLAGNVLHIEYSLNQAGPASVTIFDISGRAVLTREFAGTREGELPLDLRHVSGGVYLVRLDDGQQSLVQKLVVQR